MHLAQLNVAQHRFAMDAPEMADFVAALDNINALAERSAGFIWRLKDDGGDATGLRMAGRDNLLVNLSVWRDLGSLRTFVYETAHAAVMARRAKWFEGFGGGHVALWWIAEGLTPDLAEAARRLDRLHALGPTPAAFTFDAPFDENGAPLPSSSPLQDHA
jgi:hypothetical protein